jgi:DNA repair protein RadC
MKAQSEERAIYAVDTQTQEQKDNDTVAQAIGILFNRMVEKTDCMSSPQIVRDYLRLKLAAKEHEVFVCLFLDAQNRLITYEELFRGTLTQTSVYPREVVKAALAHNCAGVIFSHNHPSGVSEPSRADELLTKTLVEALKLVDVKVLDHIIVAGAGVPLSFAERGLI